MRETSERDAAEAALDEVRERGDRAGALARSAAPVLLAAAEELHAGYRAALTHPESFARGLSRSASDDLVERSVRAEFAVALGVSERVASRELDEARLLVEDLPRTRAALAGALIRWEAGRLICAVAQTLPSSSRAVFDERAAELALATTPTQLRRALARLREEVHEEPLAERHVRAREDRAVWVVPEVDGMATLCALLPAPVALGAFARLDRIARTLRDGAPGGGDSQGQGTHGEGSAGGEGSASGDERTLSQLRADAFADLLCDGDVSGTAPTGESVAPSPTFLPGVRAEVRLTIAASTAAGLDETPADLDGYGPIPARAARELLGTAASFTRVLVDTSGTVASVGRTHRVPPAQMRLHLQLRDRTCRFPGCTRSAAITEADHTIEWRNGGETALHNLASLCVAHHHVRHGDRWTYVLHPDGTADWTTPTGRRVSTRPATVPGAHELARPRPRFDEAPVPF